MTEVTKDMILDYLVKKGGVVKNVDLVRHFRKYLQIENAALKGTKLAAFLSLLGRAHNSAHSLGQLSADLAFMGA